MHCIRLPDNSGTIVGLPTMLWDHFTWSKLRETNRKASANLTRVNITVWKKTFRVVQSIPNINAMTRVTDISIAALMSTVF